MKTNLILIAGLVLASLNTLSVAAADVSALEQTIERAYYRGDAASLATAEVELATAVAEEPKEPALRYLEGFAAYARATFEYRTKDKKALEAGLVRADELLAKVKGQPWAAEAMALRGSIAGQLIGARGSSSGMTLGPKMMRLTTEAFGDAPESPRAMMFHGVTLLNTPEMFGGDRAEALKLFTRATDIFRRKAPASSPQWGEAEALQWLAQAKLKMGDLAGAKAAADEALKCESEYAAVRHSLLPAIEKKIAAK